MVYLYLSKIEGENRAEVSKEAQDILRYAMKKLADIDDIPEIMRAENGKPSFAYDIGWHFSISHSKTRILVGVSKTELGVDIEDEREVRETIRERFSSDEFNFFELWTLMEATYKLTGERVENFRRAGTEILCEDERVRAVLVEKMGDFELAFSVYGEDVGYSLEKILKK